VRGATPAAPPQTAPVAETPVPGPAAATGAQTPTVYLEKVGPAAVSLGKPFAYEIVARNTGAVKVFNVRVEDELPAGARFLNAEPPPDVRGLQPAWTLGALEPGAERRIKVEIQPVSEG